jgi:hypothetical protein
VESVPWQRSAAGGLFPWRRRALLEYAHLPLEPVVPHMELEPTCSWFVVPPHPQLEQENHLAGAGAPPAVGAGGAPPAGARKPHLPLEAHLLGRGAPHAAGAVVATPVHRLQCCGLPRNRTRGSKSLNPSLEEKT